MRYYLKFCIFLLRFPQRQDSNDVTDIVSHIVAVVWLISIKNKVTRLFKKKFQQFVGGE